MTELKTIAEGLRFPEGPVMLADGSVAVVEIARGTVTRVAQDGSISVIATPGGGPNGLALGPDGALFVCNNGGFVWHEEPGMIRPIGTPDDYAGGRIERIDVATGTVTVLYDACNGIKLKGRTTSCSTALVASTSPIWARPGTATATRAAFTTPARTAASSPRSCSRC